jgi:hypothetical protein
MYKNLFEGNDDPAKQEHYHFEGFPKLKDDEQCPLTVTPGRAGSAPVYCRTFVFQRYSLPLERVGDVDTPPSQTIEVLLKCVPEWIEAWVTATNAVEFCGERIRVDSEWKKFTETAKIWITERNKPCKKEYAEFAWEFRMGGEEKYCLRRLKGRQEEVRDALVDLLSGWTKDKLAMNRVDGTYQIGELLYDICFIYNPLVKDERLQDLARV